MASKIIFTPEMDAFISDHVGCMTMTGISKCMGICIPTVKNRIKQLKLWSEHLAFESKRIKELTPPKGSLPEFNVNHYKGGKQKSFFIRRTTEEGKKAFWRWAKSLGYDVRHASKVVFATSKTRRTIRFVQRLRNEFPDYTYRDLSQLSNLKNEED